MKIPTQFMLMLMAAGASATAAADWPHIQGPKMDRKTDEQVATPFPAGGPKRVWDIPVKGGFGSFVTGGGKAYAVVPLDGRETAMAVDRQSGKVLWRAPLGATGYTKGGDRGVPGNDGGDGPRATPVFADGRVFVFGAHFDLYALDSATGRVVWKHDLLKEFGGRELHWSNAASPLVIGDRVLVAGGGKGQSLLAFNAATGQVVWKSGSDQPSYATPVPATIHGQLQAIFLTARGLAAVDPTDGRELWTYPFPMQTATAASPVVWQDVVHCTAGYGVGGAAVRVKRDGDRWETTELWRIRGARDVASHWMTAVAHEGYLYGCYGQGAYGSAAFKCIDIQTGKVQWEKPGFGHGQTIMSGNRLLAISDAGRLVAIEPSPSKYQEVGAAKVIDGKVWASLALSDGQLFVRSVAHGVCLEL